MSERGAATIVGAGPGVGASVARRFGREGHPVGLVARDRDRLAGLVHELEADGARAAAAVADARRPDELRKALDDLVTELGPTEILCFSPLADVSLIKPVLETTAEDFAGTLLFTAGSAALTPSAERATSGVTYGAENVYVRMLHDALAGEGIHVAQTVIAGSIGPAKQHEPDVVAEHLWQRHVRNDDPLTVIR